MQYDVDENGKFINARRKEEITRCKDCIYRDEVFNECWCDEHITKPNGFCDIGRKENNEDFK